MTDFLHRVKNWTTCARQRRVRRRLEAGVRPHCPILSLRGKDAIREWKVGREKHWPGSHFVKVDEEWLLGGRWPGSQA